jgi:hypothetical protein
LEIENLKVQCQNGLIMWRKLQILFKFVTYFSTFIWL